MAENYYEILQVSPQASSTVIRAAYKAMAQQYHPDNYPDDGVMMRKINEAYDVLSDPGRRKKYDSEILKKNKNDGGMREKDSVKNGQKGTSSPEQKQEKEERGKDGEEEKKDYVMERLQNGSFPEKVFWVMATIVYLLVEGVVYIVQYAWGIILILLIIGIFTGHTGAAYSAVGDWLKNKLHFSTADNDEVEEVVDKEESDTDGIVEQDMKIEAIYEEDVQGDVYLLPDVAIKYYSEKELAHLTKEELRLARNEIYARHGRMFSSQDLQGYFEEKSWYVPVYTAEEFTDIEKDVFNEYEKANIVMIQKMEQ